jgi:hypothetical protein
MARLDARSGRRSCTGSRARRRRLSPLDRAPIGPRREHYLVDIARAVRDYHTARSPARSRRCRQDDAIARVALRSRSPEPAIASLERAHEADGRPPEPCARVADAAARSAVRREYVTRSAASRSVSPRCATRCPARRCRGSPCRTTTSRARGPVPDEGERPGIVPVHRGACSRSSASRARSRSGCSRVKAAPRRRTAASTSCAGRGRAPAVDRLRLGHLVRARPGGAARHLWEGRRVRRQRAAPRRHEDPVRGLRPAAPTTSVSMTINGPAPMLLAMFFNTAIDQQVDGSSPRGGARPPRRAGDASAAAV